MEIDLYPGAALGFRIWKLEDGDFLPIYGHLRSVIGEPWTGANASCRHRHPAPAPDCQCGYHAYHDPRLAIGLRWRFSLRSSEDHVLAAVAGAGHLELHDQGWRAEKIQVLGLMGSRRSVRQVAEAHQVPSFSSDHALIEYALTIPEAASVLSDKQIKAAMIS